MSYAFDPEVAALIPLLPPLDADPAETTAAMESMLAQLPAPDTTGLKVEDRQVPGWNGNPEVTVRVYRPVQPAAPAAVYWIHGGGFVTGNLEMDHARNVELARELGVVVVSVDYRLAPNTRYPGPLEDVYAGLIWMAHNADELGVDPGRIAIAGGSAGGGLCAGLALLARDLGGPQIAFQFLSVPEIDDRLDTPSMLEFTDTPLWNRARAVASWEAYLGPGRPGSDDVDYYAAPARATDLSGLPPAYVSVMQFDPLRDEDISYALAMLRAGVSVELHLFPGTFHGSGLMAEAAVSRRERHERTAVLRRALAL